MFSQKPPSLFRGPRTQLFCGFVIASVACGGGNCADVSLVDIQIRCIVIFALQHDVLHFSGNVLFPSFAVFHVAIESAEQSDTSPASRELRIAVCS
jgi:hypothetical protein